MGDFVHLHLHSEYSLLDGACRITDIPKAAKAAGHSAVAITDHGVMYGVAAFYKACVAEGIKPIIGCEVYVARRSMFDRDKDLDAGSNHLILLVKNKTGWNNLIYLVSKSFTDGFYSKPRIDIDLLEKHTEGLVCLSACLAGYIPRCIVAGGYDKATEYAVKLDRMFGRGSFYLELQDHGIRDDDVVCTGIAKISRETGIPMVATNDVHYIKKADSEAQAILMCIQTNNVITDGKPIGFETDEFYYKNTPEMERLFGKYEDACSNTVKIAEMCDFQLEFGKTKLPRYKPENGMSPDEYLKTLAYNGLASRIERGHIKPSEKHPMEEYRERIEYELSVISKMGYSEYYLIVWDFVNYSKGQGIPVGPGRGSGAGSIIAYLIGITDIDSIKFELLFERFLNPERVSMPDFDIDFCYNRRDEAIEYVRRRYGEEHTAQIITFGTLAARAAVRDVGRALGMPYGDVDIVAKQIPAELGITLEKAMKIESFKKMYDDDVSVQKLIDTAAAIEGMPRHASTHAAGVVITEEPVATYVPIAVNNGVTVTQFDMDTVAEIGLLKFDFLALRYLTIINEAELQIKENDPSFDLTAVSTDDPATYDTICAGKCDGIFQLESTGIRQMLMQLKPRCIDDIIAAISLYRPGPMDSIPKYIEARHDPSKIHYCTPKLAPILDVTYGCIVYQEQVMQIFRELAGYSFGHADVVRRAISKKKQSVLDGERQAFIEGATGRGIPEADAVELFEDIVSFANYAFNKSHAAAYAVLAYRTAYLKTHYPREYESALLTSVISSTEKLNEYIADCAKQRIKILPPDINKSRSGFHVENDGIRFGMSAMKNVGTAFIDSIVSERNENGEFSDIDDFMNRMSRTDMNKRQLETLIKSGSLDSLGVPRSRLLAVYERLMDKRSSPSQDDNNGQIDMFSAALGIAPPKPEKIEFPQIDEFSTRDKLALEKESCGMYLSGHILDDYKKHTEMLSPVAIGDIRNTFKRASDGNEDEQTSISSGDSDKLDLADKSQVTVSGSVIKRTNKITKKGDQMAFVVLEDRTASMELICFNRILEKYGAFLIYDSVIAVNGAISVREDEDVKLIVNSVIPLTPDSDTEGLKRIEKPLEAVIGNTAGTVNTVNHMQTEADRRVSTANAPLRKVYLRISDENDSQYKRARAVCEIFEGSIPVILYLTESGEYKPLGVSITPTKFVLDELVEILGKENVAAR